MIRNFIRMVLVFGLALPLTASTESQTVATFFVGRLQFGDNSGNDCADVGQHLVDLVAQASTIEVQEERKLKLADDELFETPFLFMNGHDDFRLSEQEIENLRIYLTNGGFVFASGCCTNPEFPAAWRREFSRIFPNESVRVIPYDHLIYRSFYKLDRIRTANAQHDVLLEGLFKDGELLAIIGEDGLCCSFSMANSCNRGRGVLPDDAKKIALNIAVYALTH